MGLVFVYAAWTKLTQSWIQVAMAVEAYELLPTWAVEVVARTLPWAELILGLWLIVGKWLRIAAPAASALLLGFMVILVRSFALSTKKGKETWVEPVIDRQDMTYHFEIRSRSLHLSG